MQAVSLASGEADVELESRRGELTQRSRYGSRGWIANLEDRVSVPRDCFLCHAFDGASPSLVGVDHATNSMRAIDEVVPCDGANDKEIRDIVLFCLPMPADRACLSCAVRDVAVGQCDLSRRSAQGRLYAGDGESLQSEQSAGCDGKTDFNTFLRGSTTA